MNKRAAKVLVVDDDKVVLRAVTEILQREGYYVVVNFTAEPTVQKELERILNLADEIVRYKVMLLPVKKEKKETAASPASA